MGVRPSPEKGMSAIDKRSPISNPWTERQPISAPPRETYRHSDGGAAAARLWRVTSPGDAPPQRHCSAIHHFGTLFVALQKLVARYRNM
jgi:hypothetical protein